MDFKELINKDNSPRDKYLSRVLGIFSEDIASIYFKSSYSEYRSLGRPTLNKLNDKRGYTLDFTLRNKKTNMDYVCEMKCELQYQNCKYLELNDITQIERHNKENEAFQYFLALAKPENFQNYKVEIKSNKTEIKPSGIILLWGKISKDKEKIDQIKKEYNISEILSLENMINKMVENRHNEYFDFVKEKKEWSNFLFDNLLG